MIELIDKKDKKPKKINNIESDNILKTFEEYHEGLDLLGWLK